MHRSMKLLSQLKAWANRQFSVVGDWIDEKPKVPPKRSLDDKPDVVSLGLESLALSWSRVLCGPIRWP
jgi:hypothetical protein